jgi:hypothetical protein
MNDNQSPTFKLLHRAILDRMQAAFPYEGHKRDVPNQPGRRAP